MKINRRKFIKTGALFLPAGLLNAQDVVPVRRRVNVVSASNLLNGLLGFWNFDDSAGSGHVWQDATGNGWGATQHAGDITSISGLVGNAASNAIHNSSDGLVVSASIDTRATSTPFTVSFWYYMASTGGGLDLAAGMCSSFMGNSTPRNWIFRLDATAGNKVTFVTGDASNVSTTITWGSVASGGSWVHIVGGYDGTNTFLIVNNGTGLTASPSNVNRGGVSMVFLGYGNLDGSAGNLVGDIDLAGYWNRALTTGEIATLYNSGLGKAYPF